MCMAKDQMSKDKVFLEKLGQSYLGATPGLQVQAYLGGRKKIDVAAGEDYPFYDWASLTKIVFSASLLMNLYDQKKLRLNSKLSSQISWYQREHVLKNLLSHSAGLIWWKPYYKEIDLSLTPEQRFAQLEQIISSSPIFEDFKTPGPHKAVYSDLDLFILSFFYTKLTGQTLLELWSDQRDRFGFKTTNFHYLNKPIYKKDKYAPTENSEWRGKTMQAEVHDENTWALGGIAPHAGLFGEIDELSNWGLKLRKGMRGSDVKGFAKSDTVLKFTKRAIQRELGDWAAGFMMPTKGKASCGKYFGLSSVGHTGFTGTSLWYDPKRDLLITILSNRVHPTRDNQEFAKLRPLLHDWVVESLS